jgi:hypothetical protein
VRSGTKSIDQTNFPLYSSHKPSQGPPRPPLLSTESESASSRGPKAAPASTSSKGAKDRHSQEPPVSAVRRKQRPKSQDSILSLNRYLNQPKLYEDIVDEACGTNPGNAIDESTTSFTPCPPTPRGADVPHNRPAGTRPRGMLIRRSLEFNIHIQNLGSTGSSAPQISEFEIQSGSR